MMKEIIVSILTIIAVLFGTILGTTKILDGNDSGVLYIIATLCIMILYDLSLLVNNKK